MERINYSIVDVFSNGKYTGNQLAVFKNAGNIPDKEMQQIAKEINFSETTFILSDSKNDGGYDVRIFTPNEEVPFAGHPTIGTAYIIQNEVLEAPLDNIILNFKGGQITVSFNNQEELLWMKQNQPTFGRILDTDKISEVLNIHKENIDDRFPIQEVSTGLPVLVVPLKSLEAVKKVKINREKYFELIEHMDAKAIMVFSPETYDSKNDLNVRDFADYYGIPEDAATGSSNGCLAAYLVKYGYFERSEIDIRVEQGYEIERPSLLFLKASDDNGEIDVHVGGKVVKIAQGEWFL
ncbi:PhzF family phenazine biosynthesis protein [Peribacillus frigoritolerans]|jgi:trans-2,3-dihydro-3-hydroxyanthranilate isomerase|uniref:PhzF family phenazine biosynthesis protein n=1 Tax=Peribacillus TaxID=2675229 RepID=UPI0007BF773C|nr:MULTISPECIES: PhzF family phenazine biosynthesis protein [Peribacillus]PHD78826.1 PhzF family phenazine biosynthesis protein [Bacillus sp. AFS043905]PRS44655.1 PhzF family phenazine biosynthesis protein [Bacillus sp. RJGP41]QNK48704.1 PhzF family phenazine biosynthesis protein [Brevibacterium sp. PAMC23299]MCY8935286.1 PhzF family phenazine biosynthesis protein [Peribacillus frigoritolerans]MCZ0874093.1 PhzF family phenazine biosynthesis protein [Peribacillus sp. AS_2]